MVIQSNHLAPFSGSPTPDFFSRSVSVEHARARSLDASFSIHYASCIQCLEEYQNEVTASTTQWPMELLALVQRVCPSSTFELAIADPSPSDPAGPTFCAFTPNGRKIITTGTNDSLRIFKTGSDDEPANIDNVPDSSTALVAAVRFDHERSAWHTS